MIEKNSNKLVGNEDDIQNFLAFSIKYYKIYHFGIKVFLVYLAMTLLVGFYSSSNSFYGTEYDVYQYIFNQLVFTILFLIMSDVYFWFISNNSSHFINKAFNNYLSKTSINYVDKNNTYIRNVEIPVGYISCYMSFFANLFYRLSNKNGKYDELLTLKY